jgi:hypothetical protein
VFVEHVDAVASADDERALDLDLPQVRRRMQVVGEIALRSGREHRGIVHGFPRSWRAFGRR